MMRLRRASVIAALFLLAWAATASAETWVLWKSSGNLVAGIFRYSRPGPVGTYNSRDACLAEGRVILTRDWKRAREDWTSEPEIKKLEDNTNALATYVSIIQCWPVGITPSGPTEVLW